MKVDLCCKNKASD